MQDKAILLPYLFAAGCMYVDFSKQTLQFAVSRSLETTPNTNISQIPFPPTGILKMDIPGHRFFFFFFPFC